MKTIKQIILAGLVLLFALGNCLAQDDVYNDVNNHEKREKTNNKKINTGYVFIDGKYVEPPYRVRRKGMVVYINGIPMTNKPVIKKQKDYLIVKKDPGLPPSVMKMDSIDAIYKDTVPHLGVTYIQAKFNYLLTNYPYDEAINQAIDYYKSLPNIKSVTGFSGIELVAYNGDKTKILLGSSLSYNFSKSFGPNGDGLPTKRDYKSNYDNTVMQYIEKLKKGYVIFHFNDSIKYDGHFEVFFGNKQGVFIIKELHKIKHNNQLSDIEKYNYIRDSIFRGNAINKYVEILISNFNFSKIECLSISIDTNIEQNGNDKFENFSCYTKGINEISSSPTSLAINFGAAATWGTQYLGLNPSFDAQKDAILSYIVDQGYYISPNYYVDYTNGDNNWNNLTYENFIGFTNGGINYWDSHGQKTVSTTNGYFQGWIEVLYLNDNNFLDLTMAFDEWFLNNPKTDFGVFRVENPGDNNNWSGTNNRPYCLVAYSDVAQHHWQSPIIQNKSITIIGSCYGYQNGFVEACGEGGATFGYDGNSTGVFAKNNMKNLFQRLNGEINNNGIFYRNTYDAYNNGFGVFSSFKMHPPNANITLCPATKSFYPENNETVPPTVTIGYFEVDTWCDASIPASEALTFETKNGNIDVNENNPSDLYWADVVDGKSNMIVYKWTGYGRLQVNVHTDKIIAYGGGGQELDFDKKTPNGEECVFYVFNVGYENSTYVDFTADNYMILENSEVQFTDISTINEPQSYHWNFGDGGTSSLQNPVHTYYDEGSYDVTLTISTPEGNLYEYKPNYITVSSECDGELYCTNNYVTDKTVEFYASITGIFEPMVDEYRYTFDFGDGHTETFTDNSPFRIFEYDYTEYGTYETKVIVEILSQWGEVICIKECSCNTVELYDPFPCSDFSVEVKTYPELVFVSS